MYFIVVRTPMLNMLLNENVLESLFFLGGFRSSTFFFLFFWGGGGLGFHGFRG